MAIAHICSSIGWLHKSACSSICRNRFNMSAHVRAVDEIDPRLQPFFRLILLLSADTHPSRSCGDLHSIQWRRLQRTLLGIANVENTQTQQCTLGSNTCF